MPWIDGYYYFDAGTSSNTVTVWNTWTTQTSNTITTNPVWDNWITVGTYQFSSSPWIYTDPRTPEDLEAEAAEWRAREEERAREREAAAAKARVILEENLTPEQRKQLADNDWFEVITAKRTYRIRKGWAGNVDGLGPDGRTTDRFCIHPSEEVPHEDNMLAQKLLLETDEEMFLRIANRSPVYA